MKYSDVFSKDLATLDKLLGDRKKDLFSLRIQQKTMQLTKTHEIRIAKKDIARISTAVNYKKVQSCK